MVEAKEIEFLLDKKVKHSIRYKEVFDDGVAPVIGTLYVQNWFAKGAERLLVTIREEEKNS